MQTLLHLLCRLPLLPLVKHRTVINVFRSRHQSTLLTDYVNLYINRAFPSAHLTSCIWAIEYGQMPVTHQEAQAALDAKAKPPGSLGELEILAARLSKLQGTLQPEVASAVLLLFAADHGIAKTHPAVSAYPRQVTTSVFRAIAKGMAASSVLCKSNSLHLHLVDVGVDADTGQLATWEPAQHTNQRQTDANHSSDTAAGGTAQPTVLATAATYCSQQQGPVGVQGPATHSISSADDSLPPGQVSVTIDKVLPAGSACFLQGPALTQKAAEAAVAAGRRAVQRIMHRHCTGSGKPASSLVLCVGELGIGNTTCAAALLAALTGAAAEVTCGAGTGVDSEGLQAKRAVVAGALHLHADLIAQGPFGALEAVGGLELGAMAGAFLEAAEHRVPVVMDGFVSGTAALLASKISASDAVRSILFASHLSTERGASILHEALTLPPPLQLHMRLGEGTGAVLMVPLLRSACAVMCNMATLQDALQA